MLQGFGPLPVPSPAPSPPPTPPPPVSTGGAGAGGGGAAATLDFVGAPATSRFGIDALRKGGTHVVVGLYGDALPLSLPLFPFKLMTMRGSYTGTLEEMGELMTLVKAGKVPPIPVEPRPLAEATRTLTDLREGRILGRVVLTAG